MARVIVDERAFNEPMLTRFHRITHLSYAECLGLLVYIWHETQESLEDEVEVRDLSLMIYNALKPFIDMSEFEAPRIEFNVVRSLLEAYEMDAGRNANAKHERGDSTSIREVMGAMLDVGYLVRVSDTRVRIRGNDKRLGNIKRLKERAKTAAKAKWSKYQENNTQKGNMLDALHMQCKTHANTMPTDLQIHSPTDPQSHRSTETKKQKTGIQNTNARARDPISADAIEGEIVDSVPSKSLARAKTPTFDETDLELAEEWLAWARKGVPTINASPASFAEALALVKRRVKGIDGGNLNDDGLRAIFAFIQEDSFWAKNCLSPAGLLKKGSNGLRKIDNVLASMARVDNKARRVRDAFSGEIEIDMDPFNLGGK